MIGGRFEKSTGKAACAREVAMKCYRSMVERLSQSFPERVPRAIGTIALPIANSTFSRALEFRSRRGVFAIALLPLGHRQQFVPSSDPT